MVIDNCIYHISSFSTPVYLLGVGQFHVFHGSLTAAGTRFCNGLVHSLYGVEKFTEYELLLHHGGREKAGMEWERRKRCVRDITV